VEIFFFFGFPPDLSTGFLLIAVEKAVENVDNSCVRTVYRNYRCKLCQLFLFDYAGMPRRAIRYDLREENRTALTDFLV